MKDCMGVEIQVGDTVAIGDHGNGFITIAKLNQDSYDPKYKRLRFIDSDGTEFVMDRKSFRLLILTEYVKNNYANKEVVGNFWAR